MELPTNTTHQSKTAITPSKKPSRNAENANPNVSHLRSPSSKSPALRSSKSNTTNPIVQSPQNRIRQRKFVVAKKKNQKGLRNDNVLCKCKHNGGAKCVCVAYQTLRASQEEFFLKENKVCDDVDEDVEEEAKTECESVNAVEIEGTKSEAVEDKDKEDEGFNKRRRERGSLLGEAGNSVAKDGFGKVMHLVKAFEKLLTEPKDSEENNHKEDDHHGGKDNKSKMINLALPLLQFEEHQAVAAADASVSDSSSFHCTSDLVLTSENLGLDQGISVSSSSDSSSASVSTGYRRSRRNSFESCGTTGGSKWKRKEKQKVTKQKPFKLRTEQRGKVKEEELIKKEQKMMAEEEKLRIPIAQGLPWTTDQPECLLKPIVKERTRPIDLKLHSDIRAIDRAEFDQQVVEKLNFIEQLKLERERQQKMAEEEEIKRLRKELVPKAQPMPYFDRPFVPRRSMKHPTIPREPKIHIPQHQPKKMKCLLSWNDMNPCSSYLN
ncbi:uncharacterized protein LOC106765629 [Vigna radiata var. radiata]|uniref:Uncharacterized protein LOC106765629 n=1 Tax=Vigna radiata var. radiata TaxID=3916 RepID=A0A1S3UIE9_VIGRR|nr:uncharacterized protein LOC106765629 [Vigna radiata var. radiata]